MSTLTNSPDSFDNLSRQIKLSLSFDPLLQGLKQMVDSGHLELATISAFFDSMGNKLGFRACCSVDWALVEGFQRAYPESDLTWQLLKNNSAIKTPSNLPFFAVQESDIGNEAMGEKLLNIVEVYLAYGYTFHAQHRGKWYSPESHLDPHKQPAHAKKIVRKKDDYTWNHVNPVPMFATLIYHAFGAVTADHYLEWRKLQDEITGNKPATWELTPGVARTLNVAFEVKIPSMLFLIEDWVSFGVYYRARMEPQKNFEALAAEDLFAS